MDQRKEAGSLEGKFRGLEFHYVNRRSTLAIFIYNLTSIFLFASESNIDVYIKYVHHFKEERLHSPHY